MPGIAVSVALEGGGLWAAIEESSRIAEIAGSQAEASDLRRLEHASLTATTLLRTPPGIEEWKGRPLDCGPGQTKTCP